AWPYRDYVIRSFNDDKPYPQFVKEQLAGDVLEPATREGLLGTGFLVAGPWDEVGQTQQGMLMRLRVREEELEEMISAVGQTLLGLTVTCARAHNPKSDPIPQGDYYRLKAALEGVRHGDRPLLTAKEKQEQEARVGRLTRDIARREKEIAALEQTGRQRVSGVEKTAVDGLQVPMARWTFDTDAHDTVGSRHGTPQGGPVAANS